MKKVITVSLDEALLWEIDDLCRLTGRPRSSYIEWALLAFKVGESPTVTQIEESRKGTETRYVEHLAKVKTAQEATNA